MNKEQVIYDFIAGMVVFALLMGVAWFIRWVVKRIGKR